MVVVRGDPLYVAKVHVLAVATVVAASFLHRSPSVPERTDICGAGLLCERYRRVRSCGGTSPPRPPKTATTATTTSPTSSTTVPSPKPSPDPRANRRGRRAVNMQMPFVR